MDGCFSPIFIPSSSLLSTHLEIPSIYLPSPLLPSSFSSFNSILVLYLSSWSIHNQFEYFLTLWWIDPSVFSFSRGNARLFHTLPHTSIQSFKSAKSHQHHIHNAILSFCNNFHYMSRESFIILWSGFAKTNIINHSRSPSTSSLDLNNHPSVIIPSSLPSSSTSSPIFESAIVLHSTNNTRTILGE